MTETSCTAAEAGGATAGAGAGAAAIWAIGER